MHTEILAQRNYELSGIFFEWCRSCHSGHESQKRGLSREWKSTCQSDIEIPTYAIDYEFVSYFLQKNKWNAGQMQP